MKTCNLKMLYLVFGNEVSLKLFYFLFSNALFTHFYDAIAFHSYEIYILMMSIEVAWFCIVIGGVLELVFSCLDVKITTFELEKITFVVYLIVFSLDKHMKHHIYNDSMNTMVVFIDDYF
jgi:hypothetical protein